MKKTKSISLKVLAFLCILSVFAMNAKVFANETESRNMSNLKTLKVRSFSDAESGGGGGSHKTCVNEECSKSVTIGVEPYQITSTYYGHYNHCKSASSGSCNDSSCNTECDAKVIY